MNKERIFLFMGNLDCETTQAVKDKNREKDVIEYYDVQKPIVLTLNPYSLALTFKIKTLCPSIISDII